MIEAIHPAAAEAPLLYEPAQGKRRSDHWPVFRAQVLQEQPWCSLCGGTECLEVHHLLPFHIREDLELDRNNVFVLCENPDRPVLCHYAAGHRGWSWSDFDPDCVDFVKRCRKHWDRNWAQHGALKFPQWHNGKT